MHDLSIRYEDAEVESGGLEGWTVHRSNVGVVMVSGLCPVCGGDAYGPPLPDLEQVEESDFLYVERVEAPRPAYRILAMCRCKSDHGKDGAESCGRHWYVNVRLKSEEPGANRYG